MDKEFEEKIRETARTVIQTFKIFIEELNKSDLPQGIKEQILKGISTQK